jgi:hypothetical protein
MIVRYIHLWERQISNFGKLIDVLASGVMIFDYDDRIMYRLKDGELLHTHIPDEVTGGMWDTHPRFTYLGAWNACKRFAITTAPLDCHTACYREACWYDELADSPILCHVADDDLNCIVIIKTMTCIGGSVYYVDTDGERWDTAVPVKPEDIEQYFYKGGV